MGRKAYICLVVASLMFLAFVAGYLTKRQHLLDDTIVAEALSQAARMLKPPHFVSPAVYDWSGARTLRPDRVQPGTTLLTSVWEDFGWGAGIKLIDVEGNVVHQWRTNADEIWPEQADPPRDLQYVHGTHLFANGDIMFNMEPYGSGLVRMDACGKVLWRSDASTHHSVARDEDGHFWVSENRPIEGAAGIEKISESFPGLQPTIYNAVATKVSGEGRVLARVDTMEVLYRNGLHRYIIKLYQKNSGDIQHMNDVEPLSSAMADEYPLFEAGDLLLSLRNLDMVLVVDPDELKVKWFDAESFIRQHDPDFIGGGWIGVFDNNADLTARGTMLGGSRIVAVRPHTGETRLLYPVDSARLIYTEHGGKWQLLDNGNMLITESTAGHALEVTAQGETVWRWVNERYGEDHVPELLEATRYPITPAQAAAWPCSP